MGFVIRQATSEDAEALAKVEVITWRVAYRGLMPDRFLDQLSEEDKTEGWRKSLQKHGPSGAKRVQLAAGATGVIGFVRVGAATDGDKVGLIYLLYVLPEYWGCGVGKALMGVAMDELRDLRMCAAVLWVLRDNQRARVFYERLGWLQNGQTSCEAYGGIELEALCYQRMVVA